MGFGHRHQLYRKWRSEAQDRALIAVPIVCPIFRVVSNIPEAKVRLSGKAFITSALLAGLNTLEPM